MTFLRRKLTAMAAILLCAAVVHAQPAMVAEVAGDAELLNDRAATWNALAAGSQLRPLDLLRTGRTGWARVVLEDGSVLIVGAGSTLRLDQASFDPGRARVLFRLLEGRVRIVASHTFPGSGRFELETPTAVVSVRGTRFMVAYDADKAETRVLTQEGSVEVVGVLGVLGRPVEVRTGWETVVRKGAFPSTPTEVSARQMGDALAGLEPGVSPEDTLLATFRVENTRAVLDAPPETTTAASEQRELASSTWQGRLVRSDRRFFSREGAIIDQSIPEYSLTPPGQTPPGGVVIVVKGQ